MRTLALIFLASLPMSFSFALRLPPRGPFKGAHRYRAGALRGAPNGRERRGGLEGSGSGERWHRTPRSVAGGQPTRPSPDDLLRRCEERWHLTPLDHFGWDLHNHTFPQRYFVCDPSPDGSLRHPDAIFFYVGNEADVTLYLNNTGLMWEEGPRHNAVLVFAEHRMYGRSLPFPSDQRSHMGYLTSEQALADYARLLWDLQGEFGAIPVIGFGGSYGGMLATWFRQKYPHLMDGAIAGSAPIWTYLGEDPPYNAGSFAAVVTRDAQPAGGSAAACAPNVRAAWQTMFDWGSTSEGRAAVANAMRLCGGKDAVSSQDDVMALANWAQNAWDYLAMGDYPYPSDYILNGEGMLPAFPVRVACEALQQEGLQGEALLGALADAVGVFYNFSGALECFDFDVGANNETDIDADFWGWQYCTEQFQPFTRDGKGDMFWPQLFDEEATVADCVAEWGVRPSPLKATVEWGGRRIETASNIVFSNGGLDPWSGGGVLSSISDSLVAVFIPEGAHHLDLMFSHPLDPKSVKRARRVEAKHIKRWIKEAKAARAGRAGIRRPAGDAVRRGGAAGVASS